MNLGSPQRGFSLIELVMVIMIVSVAALTVLDSFGQVGRAVLVADEVQIARGSAEVCAERIVRGRRDGSWTYATLTDAAADAACAALPLGVGFSRDVVVTDASAHSACPAGSCKSVEVIVQQGAQIVASITFLVVNY